MNVLTVHPAPSELLVPWLGYTKQPLEVKTIDSFTQQEVIAAKQNQPQYILMFPRRVCKTENPLWRAHWWHDDSFRGVEQLTPEEVGSLMNARVLYRAQRHCDWVAVLKAEGADSAMQGPTAH
jgi:hypothetical protein